MNEALERLYQNTIKPSKRDMRKDREYLCAKNRANQLYEELRGKLSEKDIKTLDRIMASSNRQMERENLRFFTNGFKLGMSFTIENM